MFRSKTYIKNHFNNKKLKSKQTLAYIYESMLRVDM